MGLAKLKLKTKNISYLNKKIIKIDFEVMEPSGFAFKPGQHINIMVGDKDARAYSIYSTMENEKEISIVASIGHDGVGAAFLKSLNKWDDVDATGPLGRFLFPDKPKNNVLMFGSGTGVVPLLTMLNSLKSKNFKNHITLYFGIRDEEAMFLKEETDVLEHSLENFDCEIVYSRPKIHTGAHEGYVSDYLEIDDPKNTTVIACGHRDMVLKIKELAREKGVSEEDIII